MTVESSKNTKYWRFRYFTASIYRDHGIVFGQ